MLSEELKPTPPQGQSDIDGRLLYEELFIYVEHTIAGFPFYLSSLDFTSQEENDITVELSDFLTERKSQSKKVIPFRFINQPTYIGTRRTSDIGIRALKFNGIGYFCFIEAKRLQQTRHRTLLVGKSE
jgi:hypothetical protein